MTDQPHHAFNLIAVILCCFYYGFYVGKYEYVSPKSIHRLCIVSIANILAIIANSLAILL